MSGYVNMAVINIDVDGVVADFTGAALGVMSGMGFDRTRGMVTEFAMENMLPKQHRQGFLDSLKEPGFCAGISILPGTRFAIQPLLTHGYSVRFVTSPLDDSPTWIEERTAWLAEYFPGLPVLFTDNKAEVDGILLIDDHPKHVRAFEDTSRPAILIDQPYNRDADHFRCTDLAHAVREILWHRY